MYVHYLLRFLTSVRLLSIIVVHQCTSIMNYLLELRVPHYVQILLGYIDLYVGSRTIYIIYYTHDMQ